MGISRYLVAAAGVVTLIGPVTNPAGTVAPIVVLLVTSKSEASVPLKLTVDAPIKFRPCMVMRVPVGELVGLKLLMLACR